MNITQSITIVQPEMNTLEVSFCVKEGYAPYFLVRVINPETDPQAVSFDTEALQAFADFVGQHRIDAALADDLPNRADKFGEPTIEYREF